MLEKRDPEGTIFLSWAWLNEAFRQNPGRWRVFAARHGSCEYVGFLPLKYRVHWSKSNLASQSEIEAGGRLLWSENTGFLCDPAFEIPAIERIAVHLQSMPWARLSIRYEVSQSRAKIFAGAFPPGDFNASWKEYRISGGTVDNLICPQVALPPDYETYLQSSPCSKTRQKVRRFTRQYLDTGALPVSLTDAASFGRNAGVLLRFWTQKWRETKGGDTAKEVAANYLEILSAAQRLGVLYMPVLWREDEPLGALGHILDPHMKRVHFIVAGRNDRASEPYIGLLLHIQSIKWAIENGYGLYDFCHGNEVYKYSFGARKPRANYFSIRRRATEGRPLLDPMSNADALRRAIEMIETGSPTRAAAACRQVLTNMVG